MSALASALVLRLPRTAWLGIVGHAYDGLPDEACGLLVGDPATNRVVRFEPTDNEAASSKLYRIPAAAMMKIGRRAEDEGLDVMGVVHSHTHTTAYPSPTDVRDAELLGDWHFVIVSLRDESPVLRSYRIVGGVVTEEPVAVEG